MIVADTNLIAYRLIEGDKTEEALAVFAKDPEWFVPLLWRHELLNVLSVHVRHGNLTESNSQTILDTAFALFRNREVPVSFPEALSLAIHENISAYDAQFVVCARALGTPLVTSDSQLTRKFPHTALTPSTFLRKPENLK